MCIVFCPREDRNDTHKIKNYAAQAKALCAKVLFLLLPARVYFTAKRAKRAKDKGSCDPSRALRALRLVLSFEQLQDQRDLFCCVVLCRLALPIDCHRALAVHAPCAA